MNHLMIIVVLSDDTPAPVEALADLRRDVGQPEGLLQRLLGPLVIGCWCLYSSERHDWRKVPPCLYTIMLHTVRTHTDHLD